MPIIKHVTEDMFDIADVASYLINPVNTVGRMGKGLALEFRQRVPQSFEPYEKACKDGSLSIGTLQVFDHTGQSWGMINFPTKRHWGEPSRPDDIARGLEALRVLLQEDRYRYSTIIMPMLGCGLGLQDYEVVYPLMEQYLSDLEATIFICMHPERTKERPRYLVISGPLDYGLAPEEQESIILNINKVMNAWDTKLSDYDGIVSGGYSGVDQFIAGECYRKNTGCTYVFEQTGEIPLVCRPDKVKYGIGANLQLSNLLCTIGTDIILFKPKGHNNNRLSAMQTRVRSWLDEEDRGGLLPSKRIAIFGEVGIYRTPTDVLIPEAGDIVYDDESDSQGAF